MESHLRVSLAADASHHRQIVIPFVLGRKYLPGFTEPDSVAGGFISSAAKADVDDYADVVLAGAAAGGGDLSPGNYNETAMTFAEWETRQTAPLLATQRRRKQGSGA